MSFDIEYQVYAFERPYDAWEQVKKFAKEMRDRKSYDACANFQAALKHYRSLLTFNVVKGGKGDL
jgi:hypothetical protein